ncbi:sushi, von Willebrand factor type A, EGF and pentraxin domain-containing protein 1 isoform X3 [Nilaparvata lugens]|uniref:sushi, von Willebrand factor type A, EGF and pentraxin domain-containing protein 1 isoform X1 n=1 Tax=Nilaparvata lugens TaxID=108931 RepID=UPI00193E5EED|nr:sushi, von Willebrand factor type A, EGF and pentraxin domain-containing protein 1 isoform X1 [Nilaparvata lugens]XP_039294462.1 sushi, von Willebrand factor type A, EGF and pentraxin domain-containing protein 1 isoform X2 [Nilaparvata lugens]XP_039294463.1 sushi, von Willebrand factor type A, EGF and pentraxin domain-containing protein 1 isoform X3 [Nilaparvata lugens]
MDKMKHNLNFWSRKLEILCILTLLPLLIDSYSSKHSSLVDQNIAEAFRGVDTRLLGECSKLLTLPNVRVNMTVGEGGRRTLHFSCARGYRLLGPPKLLCPPDQWQRTTTPFCERTGCDKLPMLMNGAERVMGVAPSSVREGGAEEGEELMEEGVVVEYACESGFRLTPMTSQQRQCRQGHWTGEPVTCVPQGCPRLSHPHNGYIEEPDQLVLPNTDYGHIRVGARLLFKCNQGFALIGAPVALCGPDGQWQPSPETRPSLCRPRPLQTPGRCLPPSPVIQMYTETGVKVDLADEGAVVEMGCMLGLRDKLHGCKLQVMRCGPNSQWLGGRIPQCVAQPNDCVFPPPIANAHIQRIVEGVGRFTVGAQVTYVCEDGYQMAGLLDPSQPATLTCMQGGCWTPSQMPYCQPVQDANALYLPGSQYFAGPNSASTSLLFSIVTALSILLVLLSVCVAVVCRHQGGGGGMHRGMPLASSAHASSSAPLPPAPQSHDPDRVALIAFADGIQQSGLPTYEEAMRSAANPTPRHSFRHAGAGVWSRRCDDLASDTTSNSTGVMTLDTVSCHTCASTSSSSGQTASCRAICGSLASFDTSSVHNTEGVPLLEENELEESGIAMLAAMEGSSTPPACDNTSFKLQSADIDSIHS